MKILICFHALNNPGGILNNNEGLYAGLRELGHEVDIRLLVWKDTIKTNESHRHLTPEMGQSGMLFDQEIGWIWPANMRIPYRGKENIARWKEFASGYDLVIWQIPVPTMQKSNKGNIDWLELYDIPVKQIAYTHDGNMLDSYPWIALIADRLCGAIGVHPCAYHALKTLPIPRAMAFSAQQRIKERIDRADKHHDRHGWFSLQTFKGWKKVEDIVRAVPYMGDYPRVLAGGGIGWYYMTSKTKVKQQFIADRRYDPDLPKKEIGRKIWDIAVDAGLEYRGYLTNEQRDAELLKAKFLIDPSWSKKYAGIGDHFNRTVIDGILCGCVPIARNLGVSTNEDGNGEFFKAGENYVMIPYDAKPKDFATMVDDAINMSRKRLELMLDAGRSMLHHWDYREVAQAFIDMANGKPAGVYKRKNDVGKKNETLIDAAFVAFDEFFNAEPNAD